MKKHLVLCSNGLYSHDDWEAFETRVEAENYAARVKDRYINVQIYETTKSICF